MTIKCNIGPGIGFRNKRRILIEKRVKYESGQQFCYEYCINVNVLVLIDPLTLRSLPCSMHDPPRAPTWALTCKVSGAGNGHPERDSQEPCFGLHALPRGHRLSPRGHWAPHNPKLQYKFSTWLLREILGKN